MRIDWSAQALSELTRIIDAIEAESPSAAGRVAMRIVDQITSLSSMAERGRPGRVKGTREMFFIPYPYFAVYKVTGENVQILRIRHAAREWPVRS